MIKRIEAIISKYNLSLAEFSQKLGVSRSSLSHIFSGRNKPSLDIVLKLHKAFPEEDLYWVLLGEEKKMSEKKTNIILPQKETSILKKNPQEEFKNEQILKESSIERIVIFFKDGSFKTYRS